MSRFLLLLGPSGVGKSTVIEALKRLDPRFVYISPYMTRPLRAGEINKVAVSDTELDRLNAAGQILVVNNLYGVRYATPRRPIEEALMTEKFPVLDWPVDRLPVMQQAFPGRLFTVYLAPPSLETLAERIASDGRDQNGSRFESAKAELGRYWAGDYDAVCDHKVVSADQQINMIATAVYTAYLYSLL